MTTARSRLVGAAALTVLVIAMIPGAASAHTPYASDACDGLTVAMYAYSSPGTPNHLTVTVDGTVVIDTAFGESFDQFVPWSATSAHQWSVVVDGLTDDGDATLSGMQDACETDNDGGTSTTSTVTATTVTSTSVDESGGGLTTTTGASTTTTTEVGSEGPVPTTVAAGGGGQLPATGGALLPAQIATLLAGFGVLMALAAVRRRSA